jgi:hypothetical protein
VAGKRYSAGRVFLQVLPSFDGLQKAIGKKVDDIDREMESKAEKSGQKAGERRGKATVREAEKAAKKVTATEVAEAKKAEKEKTRTRLAGERATARGTTIIQSQAMKERVAAASREAKAKERAALDGETRTRRGTTAIQHQAIKDRINASNAALKTDLDNINKAAKAEEAAQAAAARRQRQTRSGYLRRRAVNRLAGLRQRNEMQGGAFGQTLRRSAGQAAAAIGEIEVDADTSPARRKMAELRAQLLGLSKAEIGVDIDATAAIAKIAYIHAELNKLERDDADIDVQANVAGALAGLKLVERQIDQINRKSVKGRILSMFGGLKGSAEDGANSFRVFNYRVFALVALLPALVPLLASAAGALGAITTAAVGAGAGLGVMILGFSGIGDVVSGLNDVAENAKKDTLASSKAIRTASKGVRDAQQGLSRAREQAARSAEDSNQRIADAERRLSDAQAKAAETQDRLREARRAAQRDQDELADRIKKGALDERQALIDLFNAQVAYNSTMASGGSTNLEKEQASIDLGRAQLAIKQIRDSNRDLAAESVKSTKAGIEGNTNVVAAKKDQADAARDIADAERGVAEARRDAGRAAADSALSIRDAQERLTDAQAAYNEALTKTGDIGSSSMDKLRQAMAKVGPEGIAFATWLVSLKEKFFDLRRVAQAGMLPGVQEGLQKIIDRYGPQFFAFVDKMAKVAGQLFIALGDAFTSPTMVAFFETMDKYAPDFFSLFALIGIDFMKIIAGMMTAFAPFAKDFMTGFADLTASWATWAASLKDNPAFQEFIAYVVLEGPKVLKLIKDILTTVINIGKGMAQNGTFDALVGFFDFLADVDPKIIATVVQGILGLFVASQVSAGIVSLTIAFKLLTGTLTGVITLGVFALVAALVILYQNNEWFRNKVNLIWAKIKDYVARFVDWFMVTALPVIKDVIAKIGEGLSWLWTNIFQPIFSMIWDIVKVVFTVIAWWWKNVLWPVFKAIGIVLWNLWKGVFWPVLKMILKYWASQIATFKYVWDHVLKPVFLAIVDMLDGPFTRAWESFKDKLGDLWTEMRQEAATGVNAIIDIINGLSKGFNKVMEALGSDFRLAMIGHVTWGADKIPTDGTGMTKAGGRSTKGGSYDVGGYTGPGGKFEPAGVVHRDEYVLRKEATSKIRKNHGLGILNYINQTGHLPGFAGGGLVGFGKRLQKLGFNVAEHPAFGGVHPVHSKNSLHYSGNALDINYDGHGQAFETAKINSILGLVKSAGLRSIWQVKDHFDHLHVDTGKGGSMIGGFISNLVTKPLDFLKHTVDGLMSKAPGKGGFLKGLKAMPGSILGAASSKVREILGGTGEMGAADGSGLSALNNPTGGVGQWSSTVLAALARVGQPTSLLGTVLRRMNQESSGDPKAINLWDSNARAGTPSKGLMQVIDPTFAAYRDKGLPNDIWNPLANIVASMRYAKSRYGSLSKAYDRPGGYWTGGLVGGYPDNGAQLFDTGGYLQPGWTQVLNATGKPEPVFTPDQLASGRGVGGPLIGELNIPLHGTDVTAGDVIDEIMWGVTRIEHGGKFAGRSN